MTQDVPWKIVPMRCEGAASIDSHYETYPACARPCLGCPDYSWTYQGSHCAEKQYKSLLPTPCCPDVEHPWRAYHPEVWDCVSAQCAETGPGGYEKNHEAAQATLAQFGTFCAGDMKQPLNEYWKGTHFHWGYKMEGFVFEPLLSPEVAVSGYYGWGVLAAWHLGLIAAVVSGLRHVPTTKPPTLGSLRSWTASGVCARILHVLRRHWNADMELILALVVVWIAIGDISLRGEKMSPMDVLVWPDIDKVPPGYDPTLATHLLTVRAAMGVLDSFISIAICNIVTTLLTTSFRGWRPVHPQRLLFRTLATLITIVAGIAVTSRRGICLRSVKLVCVPNSKLDAVISAFGLREIGSRSSPLGRPIVLMHFVQGFWIPWLLLDSGSEYQAFQNFFILLAAVGLVMTMHAVLENTPWFIKMTGMHAESSSPILQMACNLLFTMALLSFLLIAIFPAGIVGLSFIFTFFYLCSLIFRTRALLGPSPNVSLWELDQILAIVLGGVTAVVSIWGSVRSFRKYRSRRQRGNYSLLAEDE